MKAKRNDTRDAFDRAIGKGSSKNIQEHVMIGSKREKDLEHMSKFSVLLDNDTATTFDQLALTIRKKLGHQIKKADILRSLIVLMADDQTLLNQIAEEIRRQHSDAGK